MEYTVQHIDALKRNGRLEEQIAAAKGIVADLSRDNVIVHTGKPVGSVSGWIGAIYWQVWIEPWHQPGQVSARLDRGALLQWQFDASLAGPDLLAAARDRALAEAATWRENCLASARKRLEELTAAG